MKSLGLRGNPHILTYPVGVRLSLPARSVRPGKGDFGGIWLARTPSAARRLKEYMLARHGVEARVFEAVPGHILYENGYRIKTDSVLLTREIA